MDRGPRWWWNKTPEQIENLEKQAEKIAGVHGIKIKQKTIAKPAPNSTQLQRAQGAERNNVTKALNAGLTMQEAESYAERQAAATSGGGLKQPMLNTEVKRELPPAVPPQKAVPVAPVRQGLDALSPAEQTRLANANPQEYDRLKKETLADKDGTDDRYQTGPGQPRGEDKPVVTPPNSKTRFPDAWGTPPRIETRDIVPLPMGGMGSSTMKNWQLEKMKQFGTPPNSPSQTKPVVTTPVPPPMDRLINRPSSGNTAYLRGLPPPETISSKPSWEAVGMTQKEWENAGRPSKGDTIKPYAQRTKAELFKLDEKLEDAQRRGDSTAVESIQLQRAERNNVTKALNAGLTMQEAESYAERQAAATSGGGLKQPMLNTEVKRELPPAVPPQKAVPVAPVRQGLDALSPAEQTRLANANPQEYDRLKKETLAKRYADPDPRETAQQKKPLTPSEISAKQMKTDSIDADVKQAMNPNLKIADAARNRIVERAALGDPQAANALKFVPNSTGQLSQQAAQQQQKAEQQQQMARQLAQQTAQQQQQSQQLAAARDQAARQLGFKDAADAESKGARFTDKVGAEKGGSRGGGGGKPPAAPRLTAKERNAQAAARASKEARRVDSKGYSDKAYENAYKSSAEANESGSQLDKRLSNSGLNPDYSGHFDRPGFSDELRKSQEFGEKNAAANQKRKDDASNLDSASKEARQARIQKAREKVNAETAERDELTSAKKAGYGNVRDYRRSLGLDPNSPPLPIPLIGSGGGGSTSSSTSSTGMSGGLINYLKRKKDGLV